MKKRFTVLKAASVMLTAIILGTGCQKSLETKEDTLAQSSTSSITGEARSYTLRTMTGKDIGAFTVADSRGKAYAEVMMNGEMAKNAYGLTLVLVSNTGSKYAMLNEFEYRADGLHGGNFVSITDPVIDVDGRTPGYSDLIAAQGYHVMVYDMEGNKMAIATIK